MAMHALWNGLLTVGPILGPEGPDLEPWALWALPFEVLAVLVLFQLSLLAQSFRIRRELSLEADEGTLPKEHAGILASWWRRQSYLWVPAGLDHRRYVQAATTLALRRAQLRLHGGRKDPFYRDDVARLRRQIRKMLDVAASGSP